MTALKSMFTALQITVCSESLLLRVWVLTIRLLLMTAQKVHSTHICYRKYSYSVI